jgi:hypothetical protein
MKDPNLAFVAGTLTSLGATIIGMALTMLMYGTSLDSIVFVAALPIVVTVNGAFAVFLARRRNNNRGN